MRHCPQCGTAAKESGNFCVNCGTRLESHKHLNVASVTTISVGSTDAGVDRRVNCNIANNDVMIVEDSPQAEIRLICPHASRHDYVGGSYTIYCKLQETMFSTRKCGIFEGMRRVSVL
jgi:hypothetical protein